MLVALILGQAERARIAGALREIATVHFCELGSELVEAAHALAGRAVITEMHDRNRESTAPAIEVLRAKHPSLPVLVYLSLSAPAVRELVAITSTTTVSGVVFRSIDDAGTALRAVLSATYRRMPTATVMQVIEPLVPGALRPFFTYCVTAAARPITVGNAAAALGVPRRTLGERLQRAGLPDPSRIIGWCRLLHAAWLLDDPHRSVKQVAGILGFASDAAFHNLLRRYTGLTSAVVRELGGHSLVLTAFVEELGTESGRAVTALPRH